MATASQIQLGTSSLPIYHRVGISEKSTKKASQLLQRNHENYYMFFNDSGFHNHLAHQMLTMWAMNATPDQLQTQFDHNSGYQRPSKAPSNNVVEHLQDPEKFIGHLGSRNHFNDFMEFFQNEISKHGWQQTLKTFVLARDERAEAMFARLFAGLLHPIIHLGFGVEFEQPAIVAEALAQAACHGDNLGKVLRAAEEKAKQSKNAGPGSIVQLINELHANKSAQEVDVLAQIRLNAEQLHEKTAEMANAVAYYTGGVNKPGQKVNINFYWMHAVNAAIFFSAFLKQEWLSHEEKIRLLEWKIRADLHYYSNSGAPEVGMEIFREYKPKKPSGWEAIEDRVLALDDDGHASKLIRALAHGAEICKPYESKDSFRLKSEDWLQFGHMAIDAHEPDGGRYSRF